MHSIAIAMPIKPGKSEAWKQYVAELTGRWRETYETEQRRFGIRRNAGWLQQSPNGDIAIIYWEIEDPDLQRQQFQQIMTSNDEYYTWVRENLTDIFGFEPGQGRPDVPELVMDYRLQSNDSRYP